MKTLEGKVALVTGGSSGIGAAAAKTREGTKVVIAARRTYKGEAVAREIAAQGGPKPCFNNAL